MTDLFDKDLPEPEKNEAVDSNQTASDSSNTGSVDENKSDDNRQWFVIHCYSGYENKVRKNLEQRIETMAMKDKIFDVVIPTQVMF